MKGTPSMGKKSKHPTHTICRRCGHKSFNKRLGYCANCGFGRSKKIRRYSWMNKHPLTRKRLK